MGKGDSLVSSYQDFSKVCKSFLKFPHYFGEIGPYSGDGELVKLVYQKYSSWANNCWVGIENLIE